ncbi:MAG TPA: hypothetical protein PLU39_03560 [Armatimonadota bacterium]|nr:hypothetical protein [Armatimonadota bacterium]HPT96924.1 hypothetical protein [Armatimonadota bacterium]
MAITQEQLAHRRRCRTRWVLNSVTAWNVLAPPPTAIVRARLIPNSWLGTSLPSRTRPCYERVGVIHVHTNYSDGLSSFQEVVEVARRCDLDFMITSDHNTLAPLRDGWEGYYGDCLALVGVEITCDEGYVLGLNLPPEFEPRRDAAARVLSEIRGAGGLAFFCLVCDPRFAWRSLPKDGYVGMEVINLGTQGMRTLNLVNLARAAIRYHRSGSIRAFSLLARRPAPELKVWDELSRERPIVGLGCVDAHSLFKVNGRPVPLPSYRDNFNLLRTHVLCRESATGDFHRDSALLYEAIASGRCFFSYHVHGDATGFRFHAFSEGHEATMGEEIYLGDGVRFCAYHRGEEAIYRLFRNGRPIATVRGDHLDLTVHQAGVYRVEVLRPSGRLGAFCLTPRPWIYSNPIYVRPGHAALARLQAREQAAGSRIRM